MAVRSSMKANRLSWEMSAKGSPGGRSVGSTVGEAGSLTTGVFSSTGAVGVGAEVAVGGMPVGVGDGVVEQPTRAANRIAVNICAGLGLIFTPYGIFLSHHVHILENAGSLLCARDEAGRRLVLVETLPLTQRIV